MDNSDKLLTILQLSDSAFPTGGFSHSLGVESANKHKLIVTREDFEQFIIASLENAGSQSIPFVIAAHRNFGNDTVIRELDERCNVCLSNHVANRASKRQGRSIIDTSSKAFTDQDFLGGLNDKIRNDELHGHFPVMFGALCGSLELDLQSIRTMFMFTALKTMVASSVRLGTFGPLETQKIQNKMQKIIPDVILRSKDISVEDVHIRFPVVDLLQNVQDTMFSKLFYS